MSTKSDICERLRQDGGLDPETFVSGYDLRYLLSAATEIERLRAAPMGWVALHYVEGRLGVRLDEFLFFKTEAAAHDFVVRQKGRWEMEPITWEEPT